MTDKEIFEKLEAEIERLENYEGESMTNSDIRFGWIHGKTFALTSIRVLLDSMQKEPASGDLEQAIDTYLSTYFGGEKEKRDWPFLKKMAIHFAEWQKQKDEAYTKSMYKIGINFCSETRRIGDWKVTSR